MVTQNRGSLVLNSVAVETESFGSMPKTSQLTDVISESDFYRATVETCLNSILSMDFKPSTLSQWVLLTIDATEAKPKPTTDGLISAPRYTATTLT
ncbi:hypothetical protein EVAR_36254_1 [Eumeta japonica]|uniref:Uncharacterized protein n=1 Tax=Eumeta variegata TaxID=151549 RepID=A0A4C1WW15_EUMVA|nr:hypothetical protein EVAR_36254_1 [Eumeta japonica]